ncbi:alpha/beta-hydrolase [Xylaria bambusicola]|uniref:alpha/beta-hydrolase n=1 Tax=Xylaria bambusicola TaxID=326684 RepID=UPI002007F3FE|nr:alpha/beta-hydrolase [Xylaria bambusicola]KAI0517845.1 alpha/beta-hydrolase [Xylaria bambusicola]
MESPSASDVAVVFCHGCYHTPAPYIPLMESLRAIGIDAHCPQLPTSDLKKLNVGDDNNPDFDRGPPEGGYPQGHEDTETILSVLGPSVNQRKRVLMIGHSSGGWVATEAARPELQATTRRDQGLAGGIIGILYIGAFVIPVGESIHGFFQPNDGSFAVPPFLDFHVRKADFLIIFLLLSTDNKKWLATLTASPVLKTKLSNNAYEALPCAYLILEGDQALPKEYQESMVALQVQKTGDFTLYRCPSGHSPHLSCTDGTAQIIQEFVKEIEN